MELEQNLNKFLADLNVFYRKLQNYHWNIEGKDFFIVHAKLEEYYDEVNTSIDEIAEHILILGGEPIGTLKGYLEKACIQEAKDAKIKSDVIYNDIINDFDKLLKKVIEIKQIAEANSEYGTSSLMDEYISNYTKKLWMLKQMMV